MGGQGFYLFISSIMTFTAFFCLSVSLRYIAISMASSSVCRSGVSLKNSAIDMSNAAQIADNVPIDGLVPLEYMFASVDGVNPASLPSLYIVQPFFLRNSSMRAKMSMFVTIPFL